MTKAPTPTEMSKGQSDNTNNATKKFGYPPVAAIICSQHPIILAFTLTEIGAVPKKGSKLTFQTCGPPGPP